MDNFISELKKFFRKGDMILLVLCLVTTAFGCLMIGSTTNASSAGPLRFVGVQLVAALLGVACFILVSSVDAETLSEHRRTWVIINTVLLLLQIPFGTDNNSGNKSWLNFPFLPFDIQPAEICKITFVIIMASVMASHQNNLSSIKSVGHMLLHLGLLFGTNYVLSRDLGVSLIFAFIFVGMTFSGGVSLLWFAAAGGAVDEGLLARIAQLEQKLAAGITAAPTAQAKPSPSSFT